MSNSYRAEPWQWHKEETLSKADNHYFSDTHHCILELRARVEALEQAAMRPKPPSLKEQALGGLSRADKDAITNPLTGEVVALRTILSKEQSDTIRKALEALPNA